MSRRLLPLLAAFAAATSGCYVTRAIRVDELPLAAKGYDQPVGPSTMLMMPDGRGGLTLTTVQPYERSTVRFHAPDGSTFDVRGKLDLIVTTTDGDVLRFDGPITVRTAVDHYWLQSRSQTGKLPKARIRGVEVRALSVGRTIAATIGGALAGTALILTPILLL